MAFLFVLKYVLSTCKTLFLESCTASTTMFSLLIPYLAPFFGIFHPRHQITGGNITYIHSTHTPHVGRDYLQISPSYQFGHFYSHASCEARLCRGLSPAFVYVISTHTPLARRDGGSCKRSILNCISTHTPLARRDFSVSSSDSADEISTHTPLARRDLTGGSEFTIFRFLLTRLLRGATSAHQREVADLKISTHTPLARRDPDQVHLLLAMLPISTHTPLARRDDC